MRAQLTNGFINKHNEGNEIRQRTDFFFLSLQHEGNVLPSLALAKNMLQRSEQEQATFIFHIPIHILT